MLREVTSNDGFILCALTSLTLLLIVKLMHSRRLIDFLGFLGNSNYLRIYLKDHSFFDRFDVLLFINFCLNSVTFGFIVQRAQTRNIEMSSTAVFICIGLLALVICLKIGFELLIGYAFDLYKEMNILTFQQISSLNFIGILLLPINLILVFQFNFEKSAVILCAISMLVVLGFGMAKTVQSNLSLVLSNFLYFILYICTLEIGSLVVLYDLINESNYFRAPIL